MQSRRGCPHIHPNYSSAEDSLAAVKKGVVASRPERPDIDSDDDSSTPELVDYRSDSSDSESESEEPVSPDDERANTPSGPTHGGKTNTVHPPLNFGEVKSAEKWSIGEYSLIDWENTPLHTTLARVVGRKKDRLLLELLKEDATAQQLRMERVVGLHYTHLTTAPDTAISLLACKRKQSAVQIARYKQRSIADSGASNPFTFSELQCVPGSVHLLEKPIPVESSQGSESYATHSGTLIMKSNVIKDAIVLIPDTLIVPSFHRTLVPISVLDDLGYYCDFGGGGLRIRKGMSGDTLFALPRWKEGHNELIGARTKKYPSAGAPYTSASRGLRTTSIQFPTHVL